MQAWKNTQVIQPYLRYSCFVSGSEPLYGCECSLSQCADLLDISDSLDRETKHDQIRVMSTDYTDFRMPVVCPQNPYGY